MTRPFRWDLSRREQLGRLVQAVPQINLDYLDGFRACAGRILAEGGDSGLVFLGRSPESLFDYLSGALLGTPWEDRLTLLNLSLRDGALEHGGRPLAPRRSAGRLHLKEVGLDPRQLSQAGRPISLIDLVYTGQTFGNLISFLDAWALESGLDPQAYRRRLRLVGISIRTKNSPNTRRWQQATAWATLFRPGVLRGIAIPQPLWTYLGDIQAKVTPSNPPWRWTDRTLQRPPRDPAHLEALRFAVAFHRLAQRGDERDTFARYLATLPAMRDPWFRRLVTQIRRRRGITTARS